MRKAIINFLKSNKDNYIFGEEIAKSLDISRAAVWKHIQILRQLGYKISSCEKRGYKLEELPVILTLRSSEKILSIIFRLIQRIELLKS